MELDLPSVIMDDLQTEPSPPAGPSIAPPVPNGPPPDLVELVRRAPVVTKLRILLRCHEVAMRARRIQALARFGWAASVVLAGVVLGVLAGLGVFAAVYDDPERYAQSYNENYEMAYYVKSEKVSRQEYDYFIATHSNLTTALWASIGAGLAVLAVFIGSLCLRGRGRLLDAGGVDEQIAAVVRDHPDAVREWGGPSVLREPVLVREILHIEEKSGR
jgi:hypothetical protein